MAKHQHMSGIFDGPPPGANGGAAAQTITLPPPLEMVFNPAIVNMQADPDANGGSGGVKVTVIHLTGLAATFTLDRNGWASVVANLQRIGEEVFGDEEPQLPGILCECGIRLTTIELETAHASMGHDPMGPV